MSPAPEPRIGDAERDAAITSLGEHYAAGRITKDEYDERSGLALRARTEADLRPLFADLPRPAGRSGPGAPRATGSRQGRARPRFAFPVLPMLVVLGVLLLVDTQAWWVLFVVGGLFFCAPWHYRRWR
jgi:Domain of unknown function (DUF1707)